MDNKTLYFFEIEQQIKDLLNNRANKTTTTEFKALLRELTHYNITGFNSAFMLNIADKTTMSMHKKVNDLLNRCCRKGYTWQGLFYFVE